MTPALIQCGAVRRQFEQGQIHRRLLDRRTVAASRRDDEPGLGVEDSRGREEGGAGDGVDRRPVDPPQHLRFRDVVSRCGQGNRPTIEHLIDQQVYQRRGIFSGHVDGADLSLCFGANMPHLPGGPTVLHDGQDVGGRLGDPAGVGNPGGLGGRCQRRLHHRRHDAMSAQHCCGLVSHVVRCSAMDRGSCLASRVSNVACCARCNASTGVGGRP